MECNFCKKKIDDKAQVCPYCWAEITRKIIKPSYFKFILYFIKYSILYSFILFVFNNYQKQSHIIAWTIAFLVSCMDFSKLQNKTKVSMTKYKG
jgi:hypothetical protein